MLENIKKLASAKKKENNAYLYSEDNRITNPNITSDFDDEQFYQDETPVYNSKTFPNDQIIIVSSLEIAYDIWLFKRKSNDVNYLFSGIYKTGIFSLLKKNGFYKRYREDRTYILILEKRNIIEQIEISQIRDFITEYIREIKVKLSFDYKGISVEVEPSKLIETFLNTSHLIFNESALGHLENHIKPLLRDTRDAMFFTFNNCIAKVNSELIITFPYTELKDICVWKEHIIQHSFELTEDSKNAHFANFIYNVANGEADRINAFRAVSGYLLHNYMLPSKGQAVIAYDEEITDSRKPEGGTGKGVFAKALRQLRNAVTIDGKRFDKDDRFCFQSINDSTQLVYFEDVKTDFDFIRLNSVLTEGWQIEVKNKPVFHIKSEDGPKTYITSNTILKGEGTTVERRQFILEFSPFYSRLARKKLEPIVHTHGCLFFEKEDWDQQEWNRFFSYMLNCGKYYLQNGLQYYDLRSVSENRVRQNTCEDFADWIETQSFSPYVEFNLTEQFNTFKDQYFEGDTKFTQRSFNNWMKTYATSKKMVFKTRRSNSVNYGRFQPSE